jgi:predicted HD superfamily hydrolase involved in NAD metabolism
MEYSLDFIKLIEKNLKIRLKKSRFEHTLRVRDTALKLCSSYKADKNKVEIAALFHDFAKNMTEDELLHYIEKEGLTIDEIIKRNIQLSHGIVAADMAKKDYGINDKEILDAIALHTYGDAEMGMISKIIYIADYIEPKRDFKGISRLRKLCYEDVDKALLMAVNSSINYLISKDREIHVNSINMRNSLIVKINYNNGRQNE